MVDTVKIRQLRPALTPAPAPRKGKRGETSEPLVPGRLDRVVEDVKLALLTTGLTLENEKQRGSDPYNSRVPAKGRDAWSERQRRR
jgi:hypothetical protein